MRRALLILPLALAVAAPALAQGGPAQPSAPVAGAVLGPALFVSDVDRSVRFYEALGMKVGIRMGRPEKHETVLTFGDRRAAGIILLSDDTAKAQAAIAHAHGFDRTVLRIVDLDQASARLKAAGFGTNAVRPAGTAGYKVMMVTDPDGYQLELVQVMADAKAPAP